MADVSIGCKKRRRTALEMSELPKFRLLCVGDGDLTLSLALARAYGTNTDIDLELVASTLLSSKEELVATYSNSEQVLTELKERGVQVLFGVDATNLHTTMNDDISNIKWDAILFHHPHLGGSLENEQDHANRHFALLAHYFASAKSVLKPSGVVHVCLCGQQPQTWRVQEAAHRQGLKLQIKVSTTLPFETWLPVLNTAASVESHFPAPRRYRNGKLGSKHFLGRYGYRHRRTHGEQQQTNGNTTVDVNVSGSLHYVFEIDTSINNDSTTQNGSNNECRVCGMTFDSEEELQQHYKAPALPDPVDFDNVVASKRKVDSNGASEEQSTSDPLDTRGISRAEPSPDAVDDDVDNAADDTAVFSSIVKSEHDGRRLKWYLRQLYGTSAGISKQQTELMIKEGRVLLNGAIVVDSGRILHAGDTIRVLPEPEFALKERYTPTTRVQIPYESDSIVVAFKPVGMRTIGSFSSQTLEMIVSSQCNGSFKAISKLDAGCAGLCVLQRSGNDETPHVKHVFTALVHGHVPESWNGTSFLLDVEGMRRWRKGGGADKVIGGTGFPIDKTIDTESSVASGDCVEIQVVERTTAEPSIPPLSTVTITTSSTSGGLCNAICYLLRKRGHPVVNDRFCRNEYLTLPRSIRNLIKNRLCISCYQVELIVDENSGRIISVPVPDRLLASHWQSHCNAITSTNET